MAGFDGIDICKIKSVHSRSCDLISLNFPEFKLFLGFGRVDRKGRAGKSDTLGNCHNFFGALELYLVQLSC